MRATETPDADHGYQRVQDYLDDLYSIRDSLISHGEYAPANGDLQDVIRLAETFGFHLVTLDIRQESRRHGTAVSEILLLSGIEYDDLDESARLELLAKYTIQLFTTSDLDDTFEDAGIEPLDVDLSGLQATFGVSFLFGR